MAQSTGYERLLSVLRSIGSPSKGLLNALLAMAAEEEPSKWSRLKVISAVGVYVDVCLVTWSGVYFDVCLVTWSGVIILV
jgi:hypothetical protein